MGATYLSRYIWYGFDLFRDDLSATQPFASLELWGTGWIFDARWTKPSSADNEVWEQLDYTLSYGSTCNEDSPWATNWRVGWRYYNHPDGPIRQSCGHTEDIDRQEFFGTFAWPGIVYQTTMDKSVNWGDGDEWWFFLTLSHLCN